MYTYFPDSLLMWVITRWEFISNTFTSWKREQEKNTYHLQSFFEYCLLNLLRPKEQYLGTKLKIIANVYFVAKNTYVQD